MLRFSDHYRNPTNNKDVLEIWSTIQGFELIEVSKWLEKNGYEYLFYGNSIYVEGDDSIALIKLTWF